MCRYHVAYAHQTLTRKNTSVHNFILQNEIVPSLGPKADPCMHKFIVEKDGTQSRPM